VLHQSRDGTGIKVPRATGGRTFFLQSIEGQSRCKKMLNVPYRVPCADGSEGSSCGLACAYRELKASHEFVDMNAS